MAEMLPVPGAKQSGNFGDARPGNRSHMGTDWAAPIGTPIYTRNNQTGTVTAGGYGNAAGYWQEITYPDGVKETIMHMASPGKQIGTVLPPRSISGIVGNTGASTGPHAHIEVSVNGKKVNPAEFYAGNSSQGGIGNVFNGIFGGLGEGINRLLLIGLGVLILIIGVVLLVASSRTAQDIAEIIPAGKLTKAVN